MAAHSYRDLVVWQKSMVLVRDVYGIASQLPAIERFALADQLRRSAVSIPSNIAEGQKRNGKAELIQFCGIALGSTAELETQLTLVNDIYAIATGAPLQICEEVSRMLTGLIKALRTPNSEHRTTSSDGGASDRRPASEPNGGP